MKNKIILFISCFVGLFSATAQNRILENSKISQTSKISELLNTNKEILFPFTLEKLTQIFGKSYEILLDTSSGNDYYQWVLKKGEILVFVPLSKKDQYLGMVAPYEGENYIAGLPFDLIFNKTTFEECKILFSTYSPNWVKVDDDNDESSSFIKFSFKKDAQYIYLYFYKNREDENVLKGINLSNVSLN